MGDVSNEPSMEDILSSIKRIIAEDSEAALSPPRGSKRAVVAQVHPVADPVPEAEEPEVLELTETVAETDAENVQSESPPAMVTKTAEPETKPSPESKPTLVSDKTAEASRSSLAALSALVVKPEVTGSDTLEGMVREMIKPMIAEWLEAKLPDIVERLVAREISRITDRG
jgi:uncharacterized protein